MKLLPGYVVREYKHHARAWRPEVRLSINSGVVTVHGNYFPRDDWHPVSKEGLRLLTQSDNDTGSADGVLLFSIPDRLHESFWTLDLEKVATEKNDQKLASSYRDYVIELADFLRFIEAPLEKDCKFQTVVSARGQHSTRADPFHKDTLGLRTDYCKEEANQLTAASINMGDEARSLIWLNLSLSQIRVMLQRTALVATMNDSGSLQDIVNGFFANYTDYPVVRLRIEPGEGCFFPLSCFVYDGYTMDMQGPDFNLLITPGYRVNSTA